MPAGSDEPSVTISVRDMLREFKDDFRGDVKDLEKSVAAGFARLEKGQEAKADKSDIIRLEEKLAGHQNELREHNARIEEIERKQAVDETAVATREKDAERRQGRLVRIYTFAGVVATATTGWFTYLLTHPHHG